MLKPKDNVGSQRQQIEHFVGVDLGGSRGKSTAVARLTRDTPDAVAVESVWIRAPNGRTWDDDELMDLIADLDPRSTLLAVAGPLTVPACLRCQVQECPGVQECVDPATRWLSSTGLSIQESALSATGERVAAGSAVARQTSEQRPAYSRLRVGPYTHRCTEVQLHFSHNLLFRDQLGHGPGAIASRGDFLRRRVASMGFKLNKNLLEVSPRATVRALFGNDVARRYKRDADPWQTRATILEKLDNLHFAPRSRLAREDVLSNDHSFDAVLSGYTGYLFARDGWTLPGNDADLFTEDGWIWSPPLSCDH